MLADVVTALRHLKRAWTKLGGSNPPAAPSDVQRGNMARDRRDWQAAAEAYRAAVADDPELVPIWVQLGHALKEQGALVPAIEAYGQAAARQPDLAEAYVFLAHLYKQLSRPEIAIGYFLSALHAGEKAPHEADELLHLLAHQGEVDRAGLAALLRERLERLPPRAAEAPLLTQLRIILTENMPEQVSGEEAADAPPALVFDISDLIAYYGNARLPTGIQRVQIETIEGALAHANDREIRLCCFIAGRDEWLELPLERMQSIARLSTSGGDRFDREWTEAVANLRLFLSLTHPFEFPRGASLVNLGTSWWLQNYFLFVRHAKKTRGIRYIPFVHDMIPIMAPQHCVRELTQDFISWVIGVFDHADHFLVNSQATRKDLLRVAATLGYKIEPSDIAVIPLDTDFRKAAASELPARALDRWQLKPDGFVLFVSTIESRKGHMVAFDAWADLIARHGADAVPQLVCVGNRGWLNDRIYERLARDPALAAKVSMLSRLTDEELSLLYRTCRFTIYPSLYEGWGLPVTESLGHGKVPLISDAASLPEAGGAFAVYAAAGSVPALVETAERLILDADHRGALEAKIAAGFRPRAWSELAHQITDELDRFARRDTVRRGGVVIPPPPTVRVGAWHPITRNESTRIWRGIHTGEGFRSNLGWHWPEDRGCRVRPEGGELLLRFKGPHLRLRILFRLRGDEAGLAQWSMRVGDATQSGEIRAREEKWVSFEIAAAKRTHDVKVRVDAVPAADGVIITYFVGGFFLHAAEDLLTRHDFIEALALGRLDTIDAYRER